MHRQGLEVVTFSYEKGKLIRAEKSTGEYFSFKWEEFEEGEFVTESKVHTGRSVSYSYRRGLPERVRINGKRKIEYEYGEGENLEKIVNARGICIIKNEYDEFDRITKQSFRKCR
ncbi:MAG: hypothetical protein SOR72_04615 [Hornefia sp.]|nr:hypothetical protein [Hornefia sp.]